MTTVEELTVRVERLEAIIAEAQSLAKDEDPNDVRPFLERCRSKDGKGGTQ